MTLNTVWEDYVVVDENFYRPSEKVDLVGDARKAKRALGWAPTVAFSELVERMVEQDIEVLRTE